MTTARRPSRALALLGAAALLTTAVPTAAAPAAATTECDGVYVVVDFTDLGGDVETGCAEGDPESGRDALESAGFAPEDSTPGLVCTIDGLPDPCPTEFTGSYWAYWQMSDGEWVSSSVGFDEADPTPGGVEGWRYNDGSEPPGVTAEDLPGAVAAGSGEGTEGTDDAEDGATDATDDAGADGTADDEAGDDSTDEATDATSADAGSGGGVGPALWAVIGVVVVALVLGVVIRRSRARS